VLEGAFFVRIVIWAVIESRGVNSVDKVATIDRGGDQRG